MSTVYAPTNRGRHVSDDAPTVTQRHMERHNERFPDGCGAHCDWHEGRGKHRAEEAA